MRKLIVRGKAAMNRVKMISVTAVKSGEGYLDVLIKILITVIIGAALLALIFWASFSRKKSPSKRAK